MKKITTQLFMVLLGIGSYAQDSLDCPVEASFTYEIEDGFLNLTNTSTGVIGAFYSWSVDGLTSWEENPSFSTITFEAEENVCLTVWDSIEDCSDTYCELIAFDVVDDDSVFIDSTDCEVEASFTYEIEGGYLNLTNTTTGAEYPVYSWWVDGLSSYEENPSFPTDGFEYEENVCLEVYDSLGDCFDTYCMLIYFSDDSIDVEDSTDCDVEASFAYVVDGGTLNLTNTSTGADAPIFIWSVDGEYSYDENPIFSTDAFETEEEICLEVYDSLADCSDTYCLTIYLGDDSTWTDSTLSMITYTQNEVKLYPNPVNDQLNVSFSNLDQSAQILLYNQVGEFVSREQVSAGTSLHQMDVDQLSKGMYILILQSDDVSTPPQQFKFIKQ